MRRGEAYEVAKRARVKNCMIADWVLSSGGCSCCCSECIGKLMMLMMIWRERKWKVLLLYVCLHSNRLVQENFPSSSPSASSFHREEISCFMIRRIGLEFW